MTTLKPLKPTQVIELMNMKGLTEDERELLALYILWDLSDDWEQGYESLPEDQEE